MAEEYIRRKDAIVAAWEGSDEWDGGSNRHRDKCIEMHIKAIPAADVVPVVRCKDCKHKGWIQEPCHGKSIDYCRQLERPVDKRFFCGLGERKGGNK